MSTVDNRVVRMEFDNKQFESGVSTTMSTLAKLKEALNFKKGGLDELQKSANAVSFDPLSNQVSMVQQKFSLLGEFARNVFDRISNKAIDAATSLGKMLAIDPVTSGFDEYGLKMGSIQTIMAGSGETLERVNEKLNELNTYADKTIYSFSDMTENIGTFTNSGVELDTAVDAIKGISNAAAIAGADTHKASSAMYNFSQSISGGYLNLMDWRSISRYAKVGTSDFAQELINTAVAMGTLRQEGDKYVSTTTDLNGKVSEAFTATKNFDESLSHQWATTEVMLETLSHYAKDIRKMSYEERLEYEEKLRGIGYTKEQIEAIKELGQKANDSSQDVKTFNQLIDTVKEGLGSGWAMSFEHIFGNFEEAKDLWTGVNEEISSILDPIAEARNGALLFWHDAEKGGRTTAIEAISDAWQGVKNIMGEVGGAFAEVIPPITGQTLVDITNKIADMAKKFKDATENSKNLSRITDIIKGVLNGFKMAAGAVQWFWEATKPARDVLGTFATDALRVGGAIGRFITHMSEAESPIQFLIDGLNGVGDAGKYMDRIVQFASGALERLVEGFLDLVGIHIEGNPISTFIESVRGFATEHLKIPSFDTIKEAIQGIKDAFSGLGDLASGGINGLLSGLGGIFESIFGAFGGASEKLDKARDSVGGVVDAAANLDTAKGFLDGFVGFVSSLADIFIKVFTTIADYLPKAFEYLGSADFQKLVNTFIGLMSGGLINSIRKFVDTLSESNAKEKKGGFFGLIESLKESAETAVKAVGEVLAQFAEVLSAFTNSINAGALLKTAVAVGVLVLSLSILANLDATKMANGLVAVAAVVGILVAGFQGIQGSSGMVAAQGIKLLSDAIVKIAIAVGILSIAAAGLSQLGLDQLAIGLLGIAGAMAVMVAGVSGLAKYGGAIAVTATSMVGLAIAIGILSIAVKAMSELSWDELSTGLAGVGILLAEVAFFSQYVDSSGLSVSSSISILLLAAALKVLETSVAFFAQMKWSKIEKGLYGVGILLGELAVFATWANADSLTISSALSILLLTAALKVLETSVTTFAGMSWDTLEQGLESVGILLMELALFTGLMDGVTVSPSAIVTLIAITAAVTVLTEVVKSIGAMGDSAGLGLEGLALSLLLLVVSLKSLSAASEGMLVGAAALLVLSVALRVFVPVLQALAAIGAEGVLVGLLGLAGALTILAMAGAIFAGLGPAMLAGAAALAAFGAACIVAGVGILALGVGLGSLAAAIVAFGAALAANAGGIAGAIETLGSSIGTALGNALVHFSTTIYDGIPTIIASLSTAIHSVGDFIITEIPYIMSIGVQFITAFAQTVASQAPTLAASLGQLVASLLQALVAWIPPIANTLIQGIIVLTNSVANGIRDNGPQILAAIRNILSSAIELILTALADIVRLIPGVGPMLADKIEGAKDVVRENLAPETLVEDGKGMIEGAASGVEEASPELQNAAGDAAQGAHDTMEEKLSDGGSLVDTLMGDMLTKFQGSQGQLGVEGGAALDSYLGQFGNTDLASLTAEEVSAASAEGLSSNVDMAAMAGDAEFQAWLSGVSDPAAASAAGGENAQAAASGASLYEYLMGQAGLGGANAYTGSLADTLGSSLSGQSMAQAGAASAYNPELYAASASANGAAYDDTLAQSGNGEKGAEVSKKGAMAANNQTAQWRNSANANVKGYTGVVGSASASAQGSHLGNTGASGASGTYGSWYSTGGYLSGGFGWGILSGTATAMAAARQVAQAALNTVRSTINSASPSKETMKYGGWFSEGFALGIENLAKYAERSGAKLGQKTLDALAVSADAITDYAKLDYDIDPTIKPVLDLTDIQNGVSQANGLLDGINSNVALGLDSTSYAQSLYGAMSATSVNPMQDVVRTLADENARSLSDVMANMLSDAGTVNNYYVNDAIVNGDADIQNAFLQLFDTLERKGAMNRG